MHKLIGIFASLSALSTCAVTPVVAQAPLSCGPKKQIEEALKNEFDERIIGRGVDGSGTYFLELYLSKDGSWTVVTTNTAGISCIRSGGDGWQKIEPVLGDPS